MNAGELRLVRPGLKGIPDILLETGAVTTPVGVDEYKSNRPRLYSSLQFLDILL